MGTPPPNLKPEFLIDISSSYTYILYVCSLKGVAFFCRRKGRCNGFTPAPERRIIKIGKKGQPRMSVGVFPAVRHLGGERQRHPLCHTDDRAGINLGEDLDLTLSDFFKPNLMEHLDEWVNSKRYSVAEFNEMLEAKKVSDLIWNPILFFSPQAPSISSTAWTSGENAWSVHSGTLFAMNHAVKKVKLCKPVKLTYKPRISSP